MTVEVYYVEDEEIVKPVLYTDIDSALDVIAEKYLDPDVHVEQILIDGDVVYRRGDDVYADMGVFLETYYDGPAPW